MVEYDEGRVFGDGLAEEVVREEAMRPLSGVELNEAIQIAREEMEPAIERMRQMYRDSFMNNYGRSTGDSGMRYTV